MKVAMNRVKTVSQAAKLVGKTLRYEGTDEWIERMRKYDAEHPENTIGWTAMEYKVNGLRVEHDGSITLLVLYREIASDNRIDPTWHAGELGDVTKYEVID